VAVAPVLSTATAVTTWLPEGAAHVAEYGLLVSEPTFVVPAKKSTRVIVPSLSLAVADNAIEAGAVNAAPFAGPVSVTVGNLFEGAETVICRELDVVVAPALSRATAVNVCVPAGALLHGTEYGLLESEPIDVPPA
jgi:hypothetical protein